MPRTICGGGDRRALAEVIMMQRKPQLAIGILSIAATAGD
jgi:hypothetical protein